MIHDIEQQLLVLPASEIRELERRAGEGLQLDALMREAAELCLESQAALASSLAAERPRQLTSVVLARYRRRWRWRLLFLGVFVPVGVLLLTLFGTAVWALVTAVLWRP
jgi:hypothetical protein